MTGNIQKAGDQQRAITPLDRKFKDVRGLLNKMAPEFSNVLPRHISADKLIRVALTTWRGGERLMDCEPLSFAGAVLECAQLGLVPDSILGRAHLVPFWNGKRRVMECNVVLGYQGLVELALRSGQVKDINAQVVYEADTFEFEYGTGERIRHTWDPSLGEEERGDPTCVYMFARLRDGEQHFQVLPWSKVLQTRERALKQRKAWIEVDKRTGEEKAMRTGNKGPYAFDTPWVTDLPEMARKTAIRYGSKLLPLSSEFQRAASLDERNDLGLEQGLAHVAAEIIPEEDHNLLGPRSAGDESAGAATRDRAAALKAKLAEEEAARAQEEADVEEEMPPQDEDGAGDEPPTPQDEDDGYKYEDDPAALTEEEERQLEEADRKRKEAVEREKRGEPKKGAVKKKKGGGRKPAKKPPEPPTPDDGEGQLDLGGGQHEGGGGDDDDIPF